MSGFRKKAGPWILMGLVLTVALAVGSRDSGDTSAEARAHRLASQIRCPTCEGLSAAASESPAARSIREEISRQVADGRPDDEVLGFFVDRYGRDIVIVPDREGLGWVVWAVPVVVVIAAAALLAAAFRRWRPRSPAAVADADRELVEAALWQEDGP